MVRRLDLLEERDFWGLNGPDEIIILADQGKATVEIFSLWPPSGLQMLLLCHPKVERLPILIINLYPAAPLFELCIKKVEPFLTLPLSSELKHDLLFEPNPMPQARDKQEQGNIGSKSIFMPETHTYHRNIRGR